MLEKLRIVFMGTPFFAANILERLLCWQNCEVVAAYCQPDRPAGRGKKIVEPAVKELASQHNLPVVQVLNFKEEIDIIKLRSFKPDVLVVAAYGLILPQAVLDICLPINVHASLLPLYRGAAPIQRAIMDCREETGVSIMHMEAGLDTGPVYEMASMDIGRHTTETLHNALADLGADVLLRVLERIRLDETIRLKVQDDSIATYAPKMSKEEGFIDWRKSAFEVDAQIRAVTPWPTAQARILRPKKDFCDVRLGVGEIGTDIDDVSQLNLNKDDYMPVFPCVGELWRLADGNIAIACVDKWYILDKVRPQSKNEMSAQAFARGHLEKHIGHLATMQE